MLPLPGRFSASASSPAARRAGPFRRALAGVCLVATLLTTGAAADNLDAVLRGIVAPRIRSHVAFLADDLIEGRAPGTRGERLAARYIATQFQRSGLQPPANGWFQTVPLLAWRPLAGENTITFESQGRRIPVRYPGDVVLWTVAGAADAEVSGELVFAGYGALAPEYDWDDFAGADLRGKILLFLAGDPPAPPDDPDRFEGIALTEHGRWSSKMLHAARRGAAAALIVHTTEGAGYPWSVVQSSWTGEQLYPAPRDSIAPPAALEGWIHFESARFVLTAAGRDLAELIARAGRRDFAPIPLGIRVNARAAGATRRVEGTNVIGLLPGFDSLRRDDAVIYTAHYDHFGVGNPVAGDSIYNGAYDNASGVAVMLEIAHAFAALRPAPPRTIVFIATTAEENGMLGARRYTEQPVIPLDRTAAVINLDGANLWGETRDIAAVGAERSTLGIIAEQRARFLGLRLAPERAPDKGMFFRSDHYPFARLGVPALHIEHGLDFRGRPGGWGAETLARFETLHYHRPSDRYDPAFDLAGAVQQARFAFLIGYDVAASDEMPRYTDGSSFHQARQTSDPSATARR
jgi:Zn-dependent M28 family amino/carboxypeptidase